MKPTETDLKLIKQVTKNDNLTADQVEVFSGCVCNNQRDKLLDLMTEKFVFEVCEQVVGTPLLLDHQQQDSTKIVGGFYDSYINIDEHKTGEDGTNRYVECVAKFFVFNKSWNEQLLFNLDAGLLNGLSIGFRSSYDYNINAFKDLQSLVEISLCLEPALYGTNVIERNYDQVKSLNFELTY